MHHFFLSYARGDDDDYVRRFFLDLSREIRVVEGLPRGEQVGFMDTDSLRLGKEWMHGLDAALSECAVFIPLYTPGYFLSEWCGREWAVFERRLAAHRGAAGEAGAFVPVIWLLPRSLPEVAHSLHYSTEAFGSAYARFGLRQLIRLRRHEDDYQEAVTALAMEIVAVTHRYRATRVEAGSLSDVPSAFRLRSPQAAVTDPANGSHHPRSPIALRSAGASTDTAADAPAHALPESRGPVPAADRTTAPGGTRRVHFVIAGPPASRCRPSAPAWNATERLLSTGLPIDRSCPSR